MKLLCAVCSGLSSPALTDSVSIVNVNGPALFYPPRWSQCWSKESSHTPLLILRASVDCTCPLQSFFFFSRLFINFCGRAEASMSSSHLISFPSPDCNDPIPLLYVEQFLPDSLLCTVCLFCLIATCYSVTSGYFFSYGKSMLGAGGGTNNNITQLNPSVVSASTPPN